MADKSADAPLEPLSRHDVAPADDWAAHLTSKIEGVVTVVRDKTLSPVEKVVRYIVFGLVLLGVGGLIAVLFSIFALRVLDDEVPAFHQRVWASYLVLAGIFWLAGALLTRRRHRRR